MKKAQLELVKEQLEQNHMVSRNWAIRHYITRLSAHIHTLRHGLNMHIVGSYKNRDYIYELHE